MPEDARVRHAGCERPQAQHPVGAVAYTAHDHVDAGFVITGHRFVDFGHGGFARPCHQEYFQPHQTSVFVLSLTTGQIRIPRQRELGRARPSKK